MKKPEGKTIAILQTNYIPWKGYFDIIACVDEFVIFDHVQYTRRDWRNRNRIIQAGKISWLSIPVKTKGRYEAAIDTIEVADSAWARKHWTSLQHAYGKARCFDAMAPVLEKAYEDASSIGFLSQVNELFLRTISNTLQLDTRFIRFGTNNHTTEDPTAHLIEICKARQADTYVSGPAAKAYIKCEMFDEAGIQLAYANYAGYPVYEQGVDTFQHGVSIVDLLFRFGPEARRHLKTTSQIGGFMDTAPTDQN